LTVQIILVEDAPLSPHGVPPELLLQRGVLIDAEYDHLVPLEELLLVGDDPVTRIIAADRLEQLTVPVAVGEPKRGDDIEIRPAGSLQIPFFDETSREQVSTRISGQAGDDAVDERDVPVLIIVDEIIHRHAGFPFHEPDDPDHNPCLVVRRRSGTECGAGRRALKLIVRRWAPAGVRARDDLAGDRSGCRSRK
jgi:hypothetical protein